jgi:hypothetical protein
MSHETKIRGSAVPSVGIYMHRRSETEPRWSCRFERSEEPPLPRHQILRCAQDDENIVSLGGEVAMHGEIMVYTPTRKSNE